jgi:hypothetical protein
MPKGPFLPTEFTATKFSTAADKAEFGNHFLCFIESEWAQAHFTKDFYHRLSMCFGHIAHVDRPTFYETWFTCDHDRLRFLEKTLKWPCWGDPEYTFSDVERAIQQEVRKHNYLRPLPTACGRSGARERDGDAQASGNQISRSRQPNGRCRRDNR